MERNSLFSAFKQQFLTVACCKHTNKHRKHEIKTFSFFLYFVAALGSKIHHELNGKAFQKHYYANLSILFRIPQNKIILFFRPLPKFFKRFVEIRCAQSEKLLPSKSVWPQKSTKQRQILRKKVYETDPLKINGKSLFFLCFVPHHN